MVVDGDRTSPVDYRSPRTVVDQGWRREPEETGGRGGDGATIVNPRVSNAGAGGDPTEVGDFLIFVE